MAPTRPTVTSRRNAWLWLLWAVSATALAAGLAWTLGEGEDRTLFMPGPLSAGHHQFAGDCQVCHGASFADGEVLDRACLECHGEERVKPLDSHPRAKFKDPRNAERLEKIDALRCVTCHVEHRPEITARDGVTRPRDLCLHCHQDIGDERPSHQGMDFMTCTSAGCHNYHDNRALYTDFLIKHLHQPQVLERPRVPVREFAARLDEVMDYPRDAYPVEPLGAADADAPAAPALDAGVTADWLASTHAGAGVNCSACHVYAPEEGAAAIWQERPDHRGCAGCHGVELERFQKGRHGMRLAVGLPPMTPAEARLPMDPGAAHRQLTCNSCHGAHRYDSRSAAVEACLDCHADPHSLAYRGSPHHALWEREVAGEGAPGSGVSCATCHMPREERDVSDWSSRIVVDHNQSATLSPNAKMVRPACLHCHGLGYALDALADRALIEANFVGAPRVHVDSLRLAEEDHQRALREIEAARR